MMSMLNPFEPAGGELPDLDTGNSGLNATHPFHHSTVAHRGYKGPDKMVFVGHAHDNDDDPALWVYKINTLHRWVEVVAAVCMVLTVALMFNQIGLHLAHSQHPGFRTYTVGGVRVVWNSSSSAAVAAAVAATTIAATEAHMHPGPFSCGLARLA
jgi:hypothetical protein